MSASTTRALGPLNLIRSDYLEVPGLRLTKRQAQRFWGIDGRLCSALIDALVEKGFLKRTRGDFYVRADEGQAESGTRGIKWTGRHSRPD